MGSKTDAGVKLAIVFFISLLSFSIGIFAGKKYSDNQHQLSSLEPQSTHSAEREVASVPSHEPEQKTGAMTDEEIAKLAEEFVADETTEAHGETAKTEEHGTHAETVAADTKTKTEDKIEVNKPKSGAQGHTPVTQHEEPSTAAKNIAAGKAPATETVEKKAAPQHERVPSSLPKDVAQYAVGKFTVQVASYADEAEAQKMASSLKGKGYSAFYIPANIKGKTWYRVSVGQFATQKEAQSYRNEFLTKSKVESAIVQKITE
ncbi:SPOR domain-containing protein [Bdellovibrio sp. 22V]|uniref:SPOR domain-containing protein n=1 Tax=Bdellovibrio sp. 22V TaxID=3044166 RepID=UPI002542E512|nr:SPOR domain-containing protein [Bdellovibrio sp. 22V]WII73113.1 SPOR domain-containing protein [Bdellovibrio sp. 22V]